MLRLLTLLLPAFLLSGLPTEGLGADTHSPDWQATLQRLDQQPVQPGTAMPDISAIMQAGAKQQQQAQSVIDKLLASAKSPSQAPNAPEPLVPLVFVSFSMPDASLKQLLSDAGKIGAQLVLLGLVDDDVKATSRKLLAVQGIDPQATALPADRQDVASMGIDPTLFERLTIQQVPTFVLPLEPVQTCARDSGCPAFRHVRLSGDVGLAYALEKLGGTLDSYPALKQQNQQWLDALQGGKP